MLVAEPAALASELTIRERIWLLILGFLVLGVGFWLFDSVHNIILKQSEQFLCCQISLRV